MPVLFLLALRNQKRWIARTCRQNPACKAAPPSRTSQRAKSPQKGQLKLSFLLLSFKRGRRSRPGAERSEARKAPPRRGGVGEGERFWKRGLRGDPFCQKGSPLGFAERSSAKQQCSHKKCFVPHNKGNTGAHDSMNSTPMPAVPLFKRYIKFPQGRKFDMLF